MAFCVLPYSLWNLAVRSPDVAVQMGMDLLSFVMEIFSFHEECLTSLNQDVVSDHKRRDSALLLFFTPLSRSFEYFSYHTDGVKEESDEVGAGRHWYARLRVPVWG